MRRVQSVTLDRNVGGRTHMSLNTRYRYRTVTQLRVLSCASRPEVFDVQTGPRNVILSPLSVPRTPEV